jgi:putative Mg2+ transporter-C (MgtC) family protein
MTIWIFILNIGSALLLGMGIGIERQWRSHPAGLRTNTLVALGAALFVSMSTLMNDTNSPTRIASYVVSGLGFLGGGVILRDGLNVKGLSTAATLWCSGAIGALAGASFRLEALAGTVAVLAVHLGLRPVVHWIDSRKSVMAGIESETYYRLSIECDSGQDSNVRDILLRHVGANGKLSLHGLSTEDAQDGRRIVQADIYSLSRNDRALDDLVARFSIEPEIKAVRWRRQSV